MPDSQPTNPIILAVFISLLLMYYYIFTKNPYYVLNYARIPVMISCLITVFGVLIFIEYNSSQPFASSQMNEIGTDFMKYAYKYFFYIFYILMISIIAYGVFKSIEAGLVFSFQFSFLVPVGLIFLVLALFTRNSKESSFDSPYLDLIKTLIMYIPCLITDAIEYIKKDYENTPSTVFIVFLMICIYLFLFYMIPLYQKQQYRNEGILLIEKAAYLNTAVLSITSDELKEKVLNQRPFYDRIFQRVLALEAEPKEVQEKSETDIKKAEEVKGPTFVVPPDSLTGPYYLNKEGFSLQIEDSQLIPFHIFKSRLQNDLESTDEELEPYKERNLMKEFIIKYPQFLTVIEKLQYMYSALFASRDTLLALPYILATEDTKVKQYNYHYALTSWIYLQEVQSKDIQHIYSFGNRPSLYYDPVESALMVIVGKNTPKYKVLYKTTKLLLQRWNFIVMNYKHGTLDLFINNNLVGTYPHVLPVLDKEDILIVGSNENERIGGICNMKYYELPLGVRKIDTIYKTFHNKKIPI